MAATSSRNSSTPKRRAEAVPDFALEDAARAEGYRGAIIGIDEAGRGPWAGPVTAGAAWLDPDRLPPSLLKGLDDSKKLKPERRQALLQELKSSGAASIGIGWAEVEEIDALNILRATFLAMQRAVADLGITPDLALVDGNRAPTLSCAVRTVVKGDSRSLSIAAASIAAKEARDARMAELAQSYPGYGWERNAGYGTADHQAAIARLGIVKPHRRSFAPIRAWLERNESGKT